MNLTGWRMEYRIIVLIIFLILPSTGIVSQTRTAEVPDYSGETMHYRLRYGPFRIGIGEISCHRDPSGCGDQIKAVARSDGLVRVFKDLNYKLECCMDPATGLPVNASRNLRDGKHNMHNTLVFDHVSRTDSTIIISQMSGQHVVSKNMFDMLTGFFHFRMNFLPAPEGIEPEMVIKTFYSDRLFDLRVRYAGEETIQTRYGPIDCYKCYPITVVGDFFKNEDDMTIWFTKAEAHVPVKIRMNLKLGAIEGEITKYKSTKTGSLQEFVGDTQK